MKRKRIKNKPKKSEWKKIIDGLIDDLTPMVNNAVDQSRANLLFMKHNMPELMNLGYDLAAAKELTGCE